MNTNNCLIWWTFAVTGPLKEKQIAYVCRETLQVRLRLWKLPYLQNTFKNKNAALFYKKTNKQYTNYFIGTQYTAVLNDASSNTAIQYG